MAAPPNDAFADADVLTGAAGSMVGTTIDATLETDEPLPAVGDGDNSVWYRWTPGSHRVRLDLVGNTNLAGDGPRDVFTDGNWLDGGVEVFTGNTIDDLTLVAQNFQNGYAAVSFVAEAATEYHIRVVGFFAGYSYSYAPFILTWITLNDPVVVTEAPGKVMRTLHDYETATDLEYQENMALSPDGGILYVINPLKVDGASKEASGTIYAVSLADFSVVAFATLTATYAYAGLAGGADGHLYTTYLGSYIARVAPDAGVDQYWVTAPEDTYLGPVNMGLDGNLYVPTQHTLDGWPAYEVGVAKITPAGVVTVLDGFTEPADALYFTTNSQFVPVRYVRATAGPDGTVWALFASPPLGPDRYANMVVRRQAPGGPAVDIPIIPVEPADAGRSAGGPGLQLHPAADGAIIVIAGFTDAG